MKINIINYSTGSHFDEIIQALSAALSGHCDVGTATEPRSIGINFVLGANILAMQGRRIVFPPNTIIYNLEQLGHNSLWDSTFYIDYLLCYPTIDYSKSNIEYLKKCGKTTEVLFLPIRHSSAFNGRIPPRKHKDIDVTVIGALTPRREYLVKELQREGLTVAYATDCWDDNRRALLARSKVVVNVRASKTGLLESTRLVSLLSSGVNCISESSSDSHEDTFFEQWIKIVDFDNLKDCVKTDLRENSISVKNAATKVSAYFSHTFDTHVDKNFEKIIRANQAEQKLDTEVKGEELISRGLYLSARKKILSTSTNHLSSIVPAVDYILGMHDRIHDVVDSLKFEDTNSTYLVTIYLELVINRWLPDEIRAQIQHVVLNYLTALNVKEEKVAEYTQKLILQYLSQKNELYLFLKHFPDETSHFDFAIELLNKIKVPKINWHDAARLLNNSTNLNEELRLHLAAEIYWKIEQTDCSALQYARAKSFHNLKSDHYHLIGDRLRRFGDFILAQVYFEKAGPAGNAENLVSALHQANNCISPSIPHLDLGKISFALERATATNVLVAQSVGESSVSFYTGGQLPSKSAFSVIDGDIRVFDKNIRNVNEKSVKALGIIACYNEIDIIEAAIRSMIAQGLEVYLIDNWSNDGTFELLEILQSELNFKLERFPDDGPAAVYDWTGLLSRKEEVALMYPGYWIVHGDADEIRISPWNGVNLANAFAVAERYGSNAIDYLILNYRPIDDGFVAGVDPQEYFRYYEIASSNDLRYQIKTWKQGNHRVDLVSRGGHFVQFEDMKVFPYKFICKHYPLRSVQHASKKINFDRIARFSPEERAKGWHSHYDSVNPNDVLRASSSLQQWNEDTLGALAPFLIQGT